MPIRFMFHSFKGVSPLAHTHAIIWVQSVSGNLHEPKYSPISLISYQWCMLIFHSLYFGPLHFSEDAILKATRGAHRLGFVWIPRNWWPHEMTLTTRHLGPRECHKAEKLFVFICIIFGINHPGPSWNKVIGVQFTVACRRTAKLDAEWLAY